jgi:hypothetical protein
MDAPHKPRLGQEPSAASLRTTAETYERDAIARDASAARHSASLAGMVANPEEMNRVSLAADSEAREAIRLREMARVLRAAIPAAETRERKAGVVQERARLEREGSRQAALWERRYSAAARVMVGVLAEIKANSQAVDEFNKAATEAGVARLSPAEFELRRVPGAIFETLPNYVELPSFVHGAAKLWPVAK